MGNIQTILLVLQVFVSVSLIGFILIQHGKGADAGAAFGSGASSTVFGSSGSSNFFTKATTLLAIIFLGNSLLLAYLATGTVEQKSLLDDAAATVIEEVIDEPVFTEVTTEPVEVETVTVGSDIPTLPVESDIPSVSEEQ
jgi:preprotein translocase subunit SecG